MIQGSLILKMVGGAYYSPVFARQTMSAVFVVQVWNLGGGGTTTVNVEVQHRNQTDASWATAGTFTAITADGVYTKQLSALKELVRYYFYVNGLSTNSYSGANVLGANPSWIID